MDDPRDWGRIAAANALSDVYAMGGRPVTALNLVGWPRSLDFELLGRVLEGGQEVCERAGVQIVGGHSVDDPEPKFGLAVTGTVAPEAIVRKSGAAAGDLLVLTKALGTGVISSAIKEGKASAASAEAAIASMTRLNADASAAASAVGVSAGTDVTGFGLVGHLLEMLGPHLDARLSFSSIPLLSGALELAEQGTVPGGSKRNEEAGSPFVVSPELSPNERTLLFDAQTSGGLLLAVPSPRSDDLLNQLRERGDAIASVVGEVTAGSGRIEVPRG
ncbi:MAG: selenide, water dikinase [Actinomycetota bacterium]|nr:selenide, water dikinase [Actinomycetota bacterium]